MQRDVPPITLPTSGTWTFGTNVEDGVRLKVNNVTVVTNDGVHLPPYDRTGLDRDILAIKGCDT